MRMCTRVHVCARVCARECGWLAVMAVVSEGWPKGPVSERVCGALFCDKRAVTVKLVAITVKVAEVTFGAEKEIKPSVRSRCSCLQ